MSWQTLHRMHVLSCPVKINANGFLIWLLSASQLGYPMSVTLIFLWLCSKFLRTHQNKHGDGTGQTTVKGVLQEGVCFSFPLIEFAWCLYKRERERECRQNNASHPSQWSHLYSELCKVYMYSIIYLDTVSTYCAASTTEMYV